VSGADASTHAMGVPAAARTSPVVAPLGVRALFGLMIAIGAATFLLEVKVDPTRAYAAFLLGFWYFVGLGLGGMFFTAIHYLAGSTWSVVVRRVAEAFASYLPLSLLLVLVVLLGIPHLYVWSAKAAGAEAGELSKGGYLSAPYFTIRVGVILAIWSLFSWYLVRNSTLQDSRRDPALNKASLKASAIFIVVFALTVTLASFDFLMSLEPTWYSTIFGVYCFAGLWQAGLAAVAIVTVILRRQGALSGIVNRSHYHDLGKFMFAFSIFWMYIAFSQFMLIWYANLPEETVWFIHRTFTGWGAVGIALGTLRFAIPFFALMRQDMKENETVLLTIGACILVGHWIDLYWLILPAFSPQSVALGWTEIGTTLGFLGLIGWCLTRFFARYPVAAHGDPLYDSSVRFHG
jgi:hypothetical protein